MAALFPFAFPLFFAGLWVGISFLMSRLSGWSSLARRYRAAAPPEGERLTWASGQIGSVSFRSCLNLTLAPSGLFLVPMLPFRLFMPPLLVPWTDVRFEGFSRILFLDFACFRLGAGGPVFAVYSATGARLHRFLAEDSRTAFSSGRAFTESLFDRRILIAAGAASAAALAAGLIAAMTAKR